MSNSAFTPSNNLSVPATTTQAGTVSTVAQTFAGKKTFDGGAAIKGDTTGSAIAAGYVGEVLSSRLSVTTNATKAVYNDVRSVELTAGIWLLTGHVTLSRNAAIFTAVDIDAGFGAIAGNTGPAISAHYHIADISTSFTRFPLTVGATVVRCDGTNIYRDDGTSYAGTTVYLKCYVGTVTSGTPQFIASSFINATRIA